MVKQDNVSGVILAGGRSRRLGRMKAIEPFDGRPLISHVIGKLLEIVDKIVVVVNDPEQSQLLPIPSETSVRVVQDIFGEAGSLGGIFTGISEIETNWGIVVACDMPFLNVELLQHLSSSGKNVDAVIPRIKGFPEPTHALYSKGCLPYMKKNIQNGDLKIANFYTDIHVRYVDEKELHKYDAELKSFFNVNTEEDLNIALKNVSELQ